MNVLERLGFLDRVVQYDLARGVTFDVPLLRHCWDRHDLESYERALIAEFCRHLEPMSDAVLFDCGADIGFFPALVCSKTSHVGRVLAFEPNPDVSDFLKRNLSQLLVAAQAFQKAVGCFIGTGRLERPDYDPLDPGRFLVPGDGPIEVLTIDSLGVRGCDVAIKIDVEGGELEVLKGAKETILSARCCAVTIEAHPLVAKRVGRDPVECLRFLESLRRFKFVVAESGEIATTSAPLIAPSGAKIQNVVGWTIEPT